MFDLRPYQSRDLQRLRDCFHTGTRRVLYVAPTGSGKTVLFGAMTRQAAARGKRILIVVHRKELLGQVHDALEVAGVTHGVIAPGWPVTDDAVQVASVWTLARRLDRLQGADLVIVDEAHHCVATTLWGKVLDHHAGLVLGVTATPQRLSGEGLDGCFDDMVIGPATADLIQQGYLSPYRLFCPPNNLHTDGLKHIGGDFAKGALAAAVARSTLTGDAIDHYTRLVPGKRALVFCVRVAHANAVAEQFCKAGVAAAVLEGRMPDATRAAYIRDFRAGKLKVLATVDLISEGFDCPGIDAVFLLRPTESIVVHRQQVGRALRLCNGKELAYVFDHANNTARHGLVDDELPWSLHGTSHTGRGQGGATTLPVRTCGTCWATLRAATAVCPYCGAAFVSTAPLPTVAKGELTEITAAQQAVIRQETKWKQAQARTLTELTELGRARGYAHPAAWAWHIHRSRKPR